MAPAADAKADLLTCYDCEHHRSYYDEGYGPDGCLCQHPYNALRLELKLELECHPRFCRCEGTEEPEDARQCPGFVEYE